MRMRNKPTPKATPNMILSLSERPPDWLAASVVGCCEIEVGSLVVDEKFSPEVAEYVDPGLDKELSSGWNDELGPGVVEGDVLDVGEEVVDEELGIGVDEEMYTVVLVLSVVEDVL